MKCSAPPVPSEVNLRNFPYMPLDVLRLRDSSLAIVASAEEFRAAVLLWCVAWHQQPAASLPNDDAVLANLAGYGRDQGAWEQVKEGALRGFIEHADGRLYHPVIVEKALEAWASKQKRDRNREAWRASKERKRGERVKRSRRSPTRIPLDVQQESRKEAVSITEQNITEQNITEQNVTEQNGDLNLDPLITLSQDLPSKTELNAVGSERLGQSSSRDVSRNGHVYVRIPLHDHTEFEIDHIKAREWERLFPAVDVAQELRKMRAWAQANRTRRKTRRGIERHVVAWLSREQDRSRSRPIEGGSAAEEAKRRFHAQGRTIDGECEVQTDA